MLSDFCVEFKFGVDTCISKAYAINALKNKFWLLITNILYGLIFRNANCTIPFLEDDYDDY